MDTIKDKLRMLDMMFPQRKIINISEGDKYNDINSYFAIPISKEEHEEISIAVKKDRHYKNIRLNNLVAIGDVNEPTDHVLSILPWAYTRNPNKPLYDVKTYWYPVLKRFTTFGNSQCIVFEEARSLWSYYASMLRLNPKRQEVLIVKL